MRKQVSCRLVQALTKMAWKIICMWHLEQRTPFGDFKPFSYSGMFVLQRSTGLFRGRHQCLHFNITGDMFAHPHHFAASETHDTHVQRHATLQEQSTNTKQIQNINGESHTEAEQLPTTHSEQTNTEHTRSISKISATS